MGFGFDDHCKRGGGRGTDFLIILAILLLLIVLASDSGFRLFSTE